MFDQPAVILMDRATGVPFELSITDHWFTEQAFDRRRQLHSDLLDQEVPLPTPEDFLLLKACYWQAAGRPRAKATQDELDLEGVIAAHEGDLDRAYLEENGRRLNVWEGLAGKIDDER